MRNKWHCRYSKPSRTSIKLRKQGVEEQRRSERRLFRDCTDRQRRPVLLNMQAIEQSVYTYCTCSLRLLSGNAVLYRYASVDE